MGAPSRTKQERDQKFEDGQVGEYVRDLKAHPNYADKTPMEGESKIEFTLRCIAHLVSPPMLKDESNEFECTDLSKAILGMKDEINRLWSLSASSPKREGGEQK